MQNLRVEEQSAVDKHFKGSWHGGNTYIHISRRGHSRMENRGREGRHCGKFGGDAPLGGGRFWKESLDWEKKSIEKALTPVWQDGKTQSINNSVKGNRVVREVEDGDQAWASVQKKTLSGMARIKSVEESWQKETALKLDPNHLLCSLLATTVSSLIQVYFIMVSDSESLRTWHLHFIHFDSIRGQSCDRVCSGRGRCFV